MTTFLDKMRATLTGTDLATWLVRLLILAGLLFATKMIAKPVPPNWDVLAYLGSIGKQDGLSDEGASKFAYDTYKAEFTQADYLDALGRPDLAAKAGKTKTGPALRSTETEYRQACASDYRAFIQQLPYYSSRYGYFLSLRALHAVGFNWAQGFEILSVGPSLILLWGFGIWALFRLSAFSLVWVGLVWVMAIPFAGMLDKICPDGYAMLFLFPAIALSLRKEWLTWAMVLTIPAVLIRPDALLVTVALAVVVALYHRPKDMGTRLALILVTAFAVAYGVIVQKITHAYPLQTLMYTNLVKPPAYPADGIYSVTPKAYAVGFIEAFGALIRGTKFLLIPFAFVLWMSIRDARFKVAMVPIYAALLASLAKMLMFPHYEDRYYQIFRLAVVVGLCFILMRLDSEDRDQSQDGEKVEG